MVGLEPDIPGWGPSPAVFLRRVVLTSAVTFVALSLMGIAFAAYSALPYIWAVLVALALTLGFVFDDVVRWRSVHSDRWQIQDRHLIHDGDEGRAQIPLSEITTISTQFGSRVILKLASGQRIAMRYLAHAETIANQIEAARGSTPH